MRRIGKADESVVEHQYCYWQQSWKWMVDVLCCWISINVKCSYQLVNPFWNVW